MFYARAQRSHVGNWSEKLLPGAALEPCRGVGRALTYMRTKRGMGYDAAKDVGRTQAIRL